VSLTDVGYTFLFFNLRQVTRVADAKEDALEKLYEQRRQKTALKKEKEKEETGLQVDRVDALPVKTLDGKVYYRTGV
jgi:nucleolar complex protein 3